MQTAATIAVHIGSGRQKPRHICGRRRTPISVTRIIPAKPFDDKRNATKTINPHDRWGKIPGIGLPCVHFDFVVTTQLRELGWKKRHPLRFINHSAKPAEARAKKDFGYPIAADRVTF